MSKLAINNFHSHIPGADILNVRLDTEPANQQQISVSPYFTVGMHPWDTDKGYPYDAIDNLGRALADPRVIGVGEIGIDPLHGAPIDLQTELLEFQLKYAIEADKPVIIHVVRRHDIIRELRRRFKGKKPWAIHSFRGKPEVARQLIEDDFYISLGPKFNPETAAIIPSNRLLVETDDAPLESISDVIAAVAAARHTTPAAINTLVTTNLHRFFSLPS